MELYIFYLEWGRVHRRWNSPPKRRERVVWNCARHRSTYLMKSIHFHCVLLCKLRPPMCLNATFFFWVWPSPPFSRCKFMSSCASNASSIGQFRKSSFSFGSSSYCCGVKLMLAKSFSQMLSLFFLITYLLNSSYVVVVSPFFIINRFVVYYCCGFSQYKKDICYYVI